MIAEVYPLTRLPRGKKAFDYLVPDAQHPVRGSFVRIPYRHEELWGIVKNVKDKPPRGITLRPLIMTREDIRLREEELSFFEHVSHDLAQSVSSVVNAMVPSPPMRSSAERKNGLSWLPLTLPSSEAQHVLRIVQTLATRGQAFVQTPDLRRATAVILGYLQKQPEQKVLILAPTVRDVHLVRSHLTGYTPHVITGEETPRERFEAWQAFRQIPQGILLGTRTALAAVDSAITTIFLLRSGDPAHKQSDRNPRYDVRELVWEHRRTFGSNVFCFDVAPLPTTLSRFHESERLNWGMYPTIQIVNVSQQRTASQSSLFSHTSLEAISQTLQSGKSVLCIYNKKEHWMECLRCQSRSVLGAHCPTCGGTNLKTHSYSNQDVAQELRRLFPDHHIDIVDKEHSDTHSADILVVTTYYYETVLDPFRPSNLGLLVQLTTDAPLYSASPVAMEELLRDVWQWAWVGFARRAPVVIETASPDLLTQVINRPFHVASDELQARTQYHLPPVYRWSRILYKDDENRRSEIAMNELSNIIQQVPKTIIHPLYRNSNGHIVLECGIPTDSMHVLLAIFTTLPDRYIIDTNAFH